MADTNPTPTPDTGPPPDSGPVIPNGKILILHASPDLPILRICFSIGAKADLSDQVLAPVVAQPHDDTASMAAGLPYPGIVPGTGGPQPDVADLSSIYVTPYLIVASSIATEVKSKGVTEKKCGELLAADGGLPATAYVKLAAIPAGTFLHGTTTLVAVTGCLPAAADPNVNDPPTAAKCGSDYAAATGNLGIKLYKALDRQVADPAKLGVQILQASSAFEGQVAKPLMGTLVTGFASLDGGPLGAPVTIGQAFPTLQPDAAAPQTGVLTDPANTAVYGALVQADGGPVIGPNGPINVALPLPAVTRLSIGTPTLADGGAYLRNGANFTFVLLGDPNKPTFLDDAGTKFNPQSMHWIALPNDPTLPPLN